MCVELAARLVPAFELRGAAFVHARSGMVLHLIPGGTARLGQPGGLREELPLREVVVAPLLVGRFPVREEEWDRVLPEQRRGREPDLPVAGVSWFEAEAWLRSAGDGLRLPLEAEWEWACRAGSETPWFWGARFDLDWCWSLENARGAPRPVSLHAQRGNAFGLVDMAGNVSEWCQDERVAPGEGGDYWQEWDPGRVHRGGSFDQPPSRARSSFRSGAAPGKRYPDLGFRAFRSL